MTINGFWADYFVVHGVPIQAANFIIFSPARREPLSGRCIIAFGISLHSSLDFLTGQHETVFGAVAG